MSEGDELPPVVAALIGDDASFLEMIARDVELASQFKTDLQAALEGSGNVSGSVTGTEAIPAEMAEVGSEAGEAYSAAFGERVQEEAAITAEDWAAYNEMFTPVGEQAAEAFGQGMVEGVRSIPEQISELLRQGLDERAQALMDQLPSVVDGSAREAGAEIGAALTEGAGAVVEGASIEFSEAFDQAFAAVKAGAMSAQTAMYSLAGAEEAANASTVTLSRSIATMRGTWAQAAAAADAAGTSEAQLAITSGVLTDAQAQLADSNAMLLLAYQQLASGADVSIDSLQEALLEASEAQSAFTESTQAMVAAQTEVNLAVIRNDAALMDESMALRDMGLAAQMAGVDASELTEQLESGQYAALNSAAAYAKASLSAIQLQEAEAQLAAANLTLAATYQRLAEGEDVSAEAQAAALAGVKSAQADVNALSGGMGKVSTATKEASGAFSGLGSLMYGPAGLAIYGLMMALPLLGGMFSNNAVTAAQFTQAVSQDSNAVGDNTAATIQSTLAKSNLSDISKTLGLSQAQLIEYAAGEKNVQDQVTAAYEAKEKAIQNTAGANQTSGVVTKASGDQAQGAAHQLYEQKQALDAVTTAVQQAIAQDDAQSQALLAAEQSTQIYNASVNALGDSMLQQTEQTQMSNAATVEYGDRLLAAQSTAKYMAAAVGAAGVNMELQAHNTEITNLATAQYASAVMGAYRDVTMFNATVDASYPAMQMQAQASAMSSVGLLNLGDSQSAVNRSLVLSEESYTAAQQGANAYNSALTALNGTTNTLLGDEASFTIALGGLNTAVQSNGKSLDVTNTKGAQNVQVATQVAQAAQAAAVAVYQNDVATGHASTAYQDANAKLAQEKQAFIEAADKAGLNKTAVQQLANELYQLPKNIPVAVSVNTGAAQSALSQLYGEISRLESAGVNVSQQEHSVIMEGQHRAAGGPVYMGQHYIINESGQEGFVPATNGFIVPHEAMAAMGAGGSGGGYGSYGGGSGGGGAPQVHVTVLLDGHEVGAVVMPSVRAAAQQYKTRSGTTGFN